MLKSKVGLIEFNIWFRRQPREEIRSTAENWRDETRFPRYSYRKERWERATREDDEKRLRRISGCGTRNSWWRI